MGKVEISHYGVIHAAAFCENCSWHNDEGDFNNVGAMRTCARKHVRETGHTVNVETGESSKYAPCGSTK